MADIGAITSTGLAQPQSVSGVQQNRQTLQTEQQQAQQTEEIEAAAATQTEEVGQGTNTDSANAEPAGGANESENEANTGGVGSLVDVFA